MKERKKKDRKKEMKKERNEEKKGISHNGNLAQVIECFN